MAKENMRDVGQRARTVGIGLLGLAGTMGLGYGIADIATGSADDAQGPIQPTEQHAPEVEPRQSDPMQPASTAETTPESGVAGDATVKERNANGSEGEDVPRTPDTTTTTINEVRAKVAGGSKPTIVPDVSPVDPSTHQPEEVGLVDPITATQPPEEGGIGSPATQNINPDGSSGPMNVPPPTTAG